MGEGGRSPDEGGAKVTTARALRRRSTDAEGQLWALLRDRRLAEFKFRRQVPTGRYVADFACYEGKLIVELDGSQHAASAYDAVRDAALRARGFRVLRIWNGDLFMHRDGVLETIWAALGGVAVEVAPPSSALRAPSPIEGEGDGADDSEGGGDA